MDIFKLIVQIIISGAGLYVLYIIGMDLFYNLSDIRKEKMLFSNGYSVSARIIDVTFHKEQPKNTDITYSTISCISVEYKVNGSICRASAPLRDMKADINKGDVIEILIDMNKPDSFVIADGSTAKSARNAIKWDLTYLFCAVILWLFLFLKIGTT